MTKSHMNSIEKYGFTPFHRKYYMKTYNKKHLKLGERIGFDSEVKLNGDQVY